MHDKFYKRGYDNIIGKKLREEYEGGKIKSRKEFEEVLQYVLSNSKKKINQSGSIALMTTRE